MPSSCTWRCGRRSGNAKRYCRTVRVSALAACSLVCLSCADGSSGVPRVEQCAPLAELAPLPSPECREEAEARAFAQSLWDVIEDDAAALLVRFELGDAARVRSICADGMFARSEWKTRRAIGTQLAKLMEVRAGPPCLAGRRLDLNRRAAKMAEVDRLEFECAGRARVTRDTPPAYVTSRRASAVERVRRVLGVLGPAVRARRHGAARLREARDRGSTPGPRT